MRNLIIVYIGFLAVCFIFYQKFDGDIKHSEEKMESSYKQCLQQKNQNECGTIYILNLVKSNPEFIKKYERSFVIENLSGELVELNTGEIIDVKKYSEFITSAQLELYLAYKNKKTLHFDRNEKNKFIFNLVLLSLRAISLLCILLIGWKLINRALDLTVTGIMYLCGFFSLLLAPFTGITVVTAAAFFIIGWILDKK